MRALLDREHVPVDNLLDVDTTGTAPLNNDVLTWSSANGTWQPAAAPGATGGEANTGSNQGTDGVGVYDTKVGVDLQFRNIAPASNKITVSLNTKDIDLDVDESNFAVPVGGIDATGTPSSSTFLRGDGTWSTATGAGDEWGDPVDAVITPDADGTRDLATTSTRFATGYFDNLDVNVDINVVGSVDGVNLSNPKNSIEVDTNSYQLVGDVASPGNSKLYGTNGSGVRGWYDQPSGGGGGPTSIDDLTDVDTSTVSPTIGDNLIFDGSNWVTNLTQLAKEVDFDDPNNYIYIGEAQPGTATSAASWRIKRVEFPGGGDDSTTLFADGDSSFNNIWDNRGSLSYS